MRHGDESTVGGSAYRCEDPARNARGVYHDKVARQRLRRGSDGIREPLRRRYLASGIGAGNEIQRPAARDPSRFDGRVGRCADAVYDVGDVVKRSVLAAEKQVEGSVRIVAVDAEHPLSAQRKSMGEVGAHRGFSYTAFCGGHDIYRVAPAVRESLRHGITQPLPDPSDKSNQRPPARAARREDIIPRFPLRTERLLRRLLRRLRRPRRLLREDHLRPLRAGL